jgi:23S rRNA U2552 (ribose-2'-O)-methylase RlmE/FtsJ
MEPAEAPPWKRVVFENSHKLTPFLTDFCFDISGGNGWTYILKPQEILLDKLRNNIAQYEDSSGCWEYYKKVVNPYECIFTQKKYDNFPSSICLLNPLSRSYFKLIEILNITDFFKSIVPGTILRTAHACEGPGGFIEAILDECGKKRIEVGKSYAITLRPRQPNVPGWKRAASFLSKHRNIEINYGEDGTGDLLIEQNQTAFINVCTSERKVHLFTADGGFDFSTDYSQQERNIFPLLLASTRVGFEVLRTGGLFIVKFFDIYSAGMRDLIFFISHFFKKWTLYKPATSRPCNPEQYFIGVGYTGCTGANLLQLQSWCVLCNIGAVPKRLFGEIPSDFNSKLDSIVAKIVDLQIYYLNKVFALIHNNSDIIIDKIMKKHQILSYKWCREFNVPVHSYLHRLIAALQTDLQDVVQQQ